MSTQEQKTVIYTTQEWAMTGCPHAVNLRDGFYSHIDSGHLDAPVFLPGGATSENVVVLLDLGINTRAIVGEIVARDGAYKW